MRKTIWQCPISDLSYANSTWEFYQIYNFCAVGDKD